MTAHKLAKVLLEGPDLPVVINGWGSDEGLGPFEVELVEPSLQEMFQLWSESKWKNEDALLLTYAQTTMQTHPKFNKTQEKVIQRIRDMGLCEPDTPEFRRNPFTGATHQLEPLACMLYDFITTREIIQHKPNDWSYRDTHFTRGVWDQARYAFQSAWPREYMDLLD